MTGAKPAPAPSEQLAVSLGSERAALRTGDHAAIMYWRPEELLDCVVPYLVAGIEAGDKVVYVADDLDTSRVADALRRTGADVDALTAAGRLMLMTAKDAFFGDGRFDCERALDGVRGLAQQAAADGYRRVRFSVEMTYLLADVPGIERAVEFEARANDEVFAQYPFVCICSFNATRATSSKVISDVLATHPILISAGTPLLNPHYKPWR
ncbi:MAG: MEDS domain-containing protein [Deltaproteobacteria bacterium]|nr:MEDS domain-containing protein [Deltaproteobacteria bacterium]